jgi:hypothetical protein
LFTQHHHTLLDSLTALFHAQVSLVPEAGSSLVMTPASLTIAPADWETTHTVMVTAENNHVQDGNAFATVTATFSSDDAEFNMQATTEVIQ